MTFFRALLEASWQGSLVIILLLVIRPLVGARVPATWRALLWALVFARLLVPAFLLPRSPASLQNFAVARQPIEQVRLVLGRPPTDLDAKNASSPGAPAREGTLSVKTDTAAVIDPSPARDWWVWGVSVWLSGVLVLVALIAGEVIRLRRRLGRESSVTDSDLIHLWQRCCANATIRPTPRLCVTRTVTSPALIGLWRPLLLVPKDGCATLSRQDWEHIFLHELAHLRRRDPWLQLIPLGALCVHWFNPLVWLGFRQFRTDRELAADDWALQRLTGDRSLAYGDTLLKVLAGQARPQLTPYLVGVMEDGAQMKQRLRQIASFGPRRFAGTCSGIGLLLGMAVVILTAAESRVNPLTGWSVVSVSIPKDGGIKDSYVELKSPEGRAVTITPGVTTREGVSLLQVDWSGAPIRAAISLQKGDDQWEITADSNLVAKKDNLERRNAEVTFESKFLEIPDAIAATLKLPPNAANVEKSFGTTAPPGKPQALQAVRVLNEADAVALLHSIIAQAGVELLSTPRVTARPRQRAVIEIGREFRYAKYEPNGNTTKDMVETTFETQYCGVSLAADATVVEGETIDLKIEPKVVEFMGYISQPSGTAFPVRHDSKQGFYERVIASPEDVQPAAPGEILQPVFSTRKAQAEVSITPGQTVVFLGSDMSEPLKGLPVPSAGKQLLVLVYAQLADHFLLPSVPQQTTVGPATTPAPEAPAGSEIPLAVAVPGKPGFVTSPHAPKAGYIDVRGYPSGVQFKCPYTGKMLQLP